MLHRRESNLTSRRALMACAGLLACGIGTAQADTVALSPNVWSGFDVDTTLWPTSSWVNVDTGSITSFTLTTAVAGVLKVVDLGNAGDTFNVSIAGTGGTQNLTTSAVAATSSSSVTLNGYEAALANPDFSRGLFNLGPGTYTITGSLLQSSTAALGATPGAVEFSPVPLPAALPLLLSGLLGFGVARRRPSRTTRSL